MDDLARLRLSMAKVAPFVVAADHQPGGLLDSARLQQRLVPKPMQADLFGLKAVVLAHEVDWEGWRNAARALALEAVPPEEVVWSVGVPDDLFRRGRARQACGPAGDIHRSPPPGHAGGDGRSRRAIPSGFARLYRLIWRAHGGEKHLLEITTDPDVQAGAAPGPRPCARGHPQDARLRPLPRGAGGGRHALRELVRAGPLHRRGQRGIFRAALRHHGLVHPDALPAARTGPARRSNSDPAPARPTCRTTIGSKPIGGPITAAYSIRRGSRSAR